MNAPDDGPLVVIPLGDGTAGVFPVAAVIEARERAGELGFGQRAASAPKDLNAGTERLLDSRQLAELLGVNDTTIEQMAKDGRLPSIRIGRLLRFEAAVCIERLRVRGRGRL